MMSNTNNASSRIVMVFVFVVKAHNKNESNNNINNNNKLLKYNRRKGVSTIRVYSIMSFHMTMSTKT